MNVLSFLMFIACVCVAVNASPDKYIDPEASGLKLDHVTTSAFNVAGEFVDNTQKAFRYKLCIDFKSIQLRELKEGGVRIYGLSP